ncbi:MAG: glycosyltransferase family 1 protein [Oscillospiraceae bacterium]|nr:glycosyltransferase family 1 protein [Oscillospiraceae bacterium]
MNEPIRVAQIVGKMVGGGVEAVVMNYYRNIDRTRVQFDLIVDSDSSYIPAEEIISLGGRIIEIPPYQHPVAYQRELTKVLRDNHYAIVHSHLSAMSFFALMAAKRAGVPTRISHCHTSCGNDGWKRVLMKQMLRPVSRVFPTNYLACSEFAGTWLFGAGIVKSGRLHVLPNAVDLKKFHYDQQLREQKRQELGLCDEIVLGHIGRFVGQKNHAFLLDIFAEVLKIEPSARLLLIGTGPLKEQIERKAHELNCEESVLFMGQRSDVAQLYQCMDVFVLPSLYEGLPVVGVEAQAAGVPCVFSDAITPEACIVTDTRMLSLTMSAREWAAQVLAAAKEPRTNTVAAMRKAGFDIAAQASDLLAIYEGAVSK